MTVTLLGAGRKDQDAQAQAGNHGYGPLFPACFDVWMSCRIIREKDYWAYHAWGLEGLRRAGRVARLSWGVRSQKGRKQGRTLPQGKDHITWGSSWCGRQSFLPVTPPSLFFLTPLHTTTCHFLNILCPSTLLFHILFLQDGISSSFSNLPTTPPPLLLFNYQNLV